MTVHSNSVQAKKASVALIRNWPLTLFSGCLLPLLLSLGLWQIQRGEEKAALNAAIDARLSAQPQKPSTLAKLEAFTPLRMLGYYTDEYVYLDNRTRNGRVGYEILQVFVSEGQRWLVNRGWIPAGASRAELPEVHFPLAAKVITGFLYPVQGTQTAEGFSLEPGQRIQQLDGTASAAMNLKHADWSVRLSADSDTALVTDWQLVNSPPERHRAYAAQWFAMAAALVLLWLIAATRIPQILRNRN